MTTHPVDVDAGSLGSLQASWTWSQVGQHQVCLPLAFSCLPRLLCANGHTQITDAPCQCLCACALMPGLQWRQTEWLYGTKVPLCNEFSF